jgi:alpha-mannosidase
VLARVGSNQVILSTIKPARWAEGYIVRLQEIAGSAQRTTIEFAGKPLVHAWATDLLERSERELSIADNGALQVDLPAWGLATVRIVFASDALRAPAAASAGRLAL